jgi:hypothetical protein
MIHPAAAGLAPALVAVLCHPVMGRDTFSDIHVQIIEQSGS